MKLALIIIATIFTIIAVLTSPWAEQSYWRWALHKRSIQRWFIYKAWQQYIPNLRWLSLLFVSGITILGVNQFLPDFKITEIAKLKRAPDGTVMLALIGAPIAYVIWWFRDSNARQQIENQRKDVNLKDFQRLAEWSAGMHLPEDKVTTSKKETQSDSKEIKEKTNTSHEKLISTETSAVPTSTVIHTHSRREGAASLQVAAIYQLQAFLQGEYGRYFQRPAFQLLKSIWLALVSQHLVDLEELIQEERDFANKNELDAFRKTLNNWNRNLRSTMNSPIGEAITIALGAQQGWLLRTHQVDLPNAALSGYNSRLSALKQPLELDGLNLTGIKLQGADLSDALLQDADLSSTQLQGTNLRNAQLQGTNLRNAQLQGADLGNAQLQGANLCKARLQGANLFNAQLEYADLSDTNLQGADLSNAQLQGTNLRKARLQGANLFKAKLEYAQLANTLLQGAVLGNSNLSRADLFKAQLQGADLTHAQLQGANLFKAQLQGADLTHAQLQGAHLSQAQLHYARLDFTKLLNANLREAELQGANLSFARLHGADLTRAYLQGANLINIGIDPITNFAECSTDNKTAVLIYNEYEEETSVNIKATFRLRLNLKTHGLILPNELYQQLFAEPTEYRFKNKHGEIETRHDVGLFSSFDA